MINSRSKGAGAELEFSNIIYQWSGIRLIRNLEQSRSGGHDLIVKADETGQVADSFRTLAIECKRYGKVTPGLIRTWWQQARNQAEHNGLTPILAYRADRQDWQVIAPLHIINATMSRNLGLESTAVLSVIGFCGVVLESATGSESSCILATVNNTSQAMV
ncbi:MAG: hypothetical protein WCP96_11465 [Methylococcaceae bacterium]